MSTNSELIARQLMSAVAAQNIWGDVIINVKEYGAQGDGETDDTAAFQEAIYYALSIGKSDIWMPPGTYKYTTLSNAAGITFYGDSVNLVGVTSLNVASFHSLNGQVTDIAINVKQYGAVGDGVTDDTAAVQAAFTAAANRRVEVNSDFNCLITGTIYLPSNIVVACNGKFTCFGDVDYWFRADSPDSVIYEQITVEVTKPFAQRTLLNRVLYCFTPTYFEVMTADIRGASTAIHCLYGEDFLCGDIILHEVLGIDEQYGYGVNSSCKRSNIKNVTAINSDTTKGRHAIYINGDIWESANIDYVYAYNFNRHPVQIVNTNAAATCYAYIKSAVFINANISPTADTSGCIHLRAENGPGVRVTVDDLRVKGIAGPAFSSQGTSNGIYIGNVYAESLLPSSFVNIYLINIRNGSNNRVGKVFLDTLTTNWLAAVIFRDTVNAIIDDIYVGGTGSGQAVRLNGADAMLGNVKTASITKVFTTGTVTVRYKQSLPDISYGTAAPTTGTWRLGDIVYNTNPSASGFVGWVCVTAGTPGTWKTFGAISA